MLPASAKGAERSCCCCFFEEEIPLSEAWCSLFLCPVQSHCPYTQEETFQGWKQLAKRGDWDYMTPETAVSTAAPQNLNSKITEAWIDPLWQVKALPRGGHRASGPTCHCDGPWWFIIPLQWEKSPRNRDKAQSSAPGTVLGTWANPSCSSSPCPALPAGISCWHQLCSTWPRQKLLFSLSLTGSGQ